MPTVFSIPSADGDIRFLVSRGSTITFCGANGSGKTRLAVHIEQQLGLAAHRISAHRALSLNPRVAKIPESEALSGLRTGSSRQPSPPQSITIQITDTAGESRKPPGCSTTTTTLCRRSSPNRRTLH